MGRWTQYDEDSYRLPSGMSRIGYDADSGRYFFRDEADGSIWRGAEGVEWGEMTRVTSLPTSLAASTSHSHSDEEEEEGEGEEDDHPHPHHHPSNSNSSRSESDLEASPRTHTRARNGAYELLANDHSRPMAPSSKPNPSSYRTLFPFFLIIAVVLLLIWRLIVSPNLYTTSSSNSGSSSSSSSRLICPAGSTQQYVQPGDSCWELANRHGWTLDEFWAANPKERVGCERLMPGTSVCLPVAKGKTAATDKMAKKGKRAAASASGR